MGSTAAREAKTADSLQPIGGVYLPMGNEEDGSSSRASLRQSGAAYAPMKTQMTGRQSNHIIQDSGLRNLHTIPLFPEDTHTFELFFLRMLYYTLAKSGYASKDHQGVHVTMFRRSTRRFSSIFHPDLKYSWEIIGAERSADYIQWDDIRVATQNGARVPEVERRFAERLFMVFDGKWNSYLGIAWSVIILLAIAFSVLTLLVGSIKEDKCLDWFRDSRCGAANTVFTLVFSVDFFVKLLCSPWVRPGVIAEDWLMQQIVVDPKIAGSQPPGRATHWQCLLFFVCAPLNIVDFLSIAPFYISYLCGLSHIHFTGFFRSLRLLRIFRVLKFSKFSPMLVVLGTTMAKSLQSIGVLVIYMVLTSLIAGSVIHQFEQYEGNTAIEFSDVPRAMWWIMCRVVSMQHSLPLADNKPKSWVSGFVVTFVGLFKGVIFVMPIGQISGAFRDTWSSRETREHLKHQIEQNDHIPVGYEWTQDAMCPVARIEVVKHNEDGNQEDIRTVGSLPIPLYLAHSVNTQIWAGVHGHRLQQFLPGRSSRVMFEVQWKPCKDSHPGDKLPHGFLTLRLMAAEGFQGTRLGCRILIPVRLHGEGAEFVWATGPLLLDSTGTCMDKVETTQEVHWKDERSHNHLVAFAAKAAMPPGTGYVCYGPEVTMAGLSAGTPQFAGIFQQDNFLMDCTGSFEGIVSEGIVGMAYPDLITGFNGIPLFDSVVEVSGVPNVFSMQCCGWNGREAATGQLVLGGVDESLYTGEFQYTPITRHLWFCVEMVGIYVEGYTAPVHEPNPCLTDFPAVPCFLWPCGQSQGYCDDGLCACPPGECFDRTTSSCVTQAVQGSWFHREEAREGPQNCNAIIDSGTSELVLETQHYQKVMHILRAIGEPVMGGAECITSEMLNSFPAIVVQLRGDVSLSIPPTTYFQPRGDGSGCHALFIGPGGPQSILGQPLMEAYYTVFDKENDRIGFAPIAGCE